MELNLNLQDITIKGKGSKVSLEWNPDTEKRLERNFSEAQKYIDEEVLKRSEPFVPRDTGALIASGYSATKIGSGVVEYDAPYARKQYYEHKGAGQRGPRWIERMKAQYGSEIRKGAGRYVGK